MTFIDFYICYRMETSQKSYSVTFTHIFNVKIVNSHSVVFLHICHNLYGTRRRVALINITHQRIAVIDLVGGHLKNNEVQFLVSPLLVRFFVSSRPTVRLYIWSEHARTHFFVLLIALVIFTFNYCDLDIYFQDKKWNFQ